MTTTVDTAEHGDADRPLRQRRLRSLGLSVDRRLERLQNAYLGGSPGARADLARLRRAVGKEVPDIPEVWELVLTTVPASLRWDHDEPSRAEKAAHAALTLYAAHQQSLTVPAHRPGISFGQAAGQLAQLARADERKVQAVTRRFTTVTAAGSMRGIITHMQGLIVQMRAESIGFDYARLADDLLDLLDPVRKQRVRLAWGRDFYRITTAADEDSSTENNTTTTVTTESTGE